MRKIDTKPVNQIDLETGKVLAVFESRYEFARHIGKNLHTVKDALTDVIKKRYKSAYGYGWEFADEADQKEALTSVADRRGRQPHGLAQVDNDQ